jgi:pilus assembly protein Flp/PilA
MQSINALFQTFQSLVSEEEAVTAIEYGLLAALIAVAIIGALSATGTSLSQIYSYWSSAVGNALNEALN